MITKTQITEWRTYEGVGYTSALGEYTPSEFWELLDSYESLAASFAELEAALEECHFELYCEKGLSVFTEHPLLEKENL